MHMLYMTILCVDCCTLFMELLLQFSGFGVMLVIAFVFLPFGMIAIGNFKKAEFSVHVVL